MKVRGDQRDDPYAWLRSETWREVLRDPGCLDARIRRHLESENDHTETVLRPVADLRRRLVCELRGRIEERDASVPEPDGPYEYFTRHEENRQHPLWCRRLRAAGDAGGADEEILLDGNHAAAQESFFRVAAAEHSPDHRHFAYSVDLAGGEAHHLRVRDLASGENVDLGVQDLQGDFVWANDSETLLYTALDEDHRPSRVYRTDRKGRRRELVYEEPDPAFHLAVGKTENRAYLTISGSDHSDTREIRWLDANRPDAAARLLFARSPGVDIRFAATGDQAYLLSNADGAVDYKIVVAPLDRPDRQNWLELVPHRPGILIKAMQLFARHLVRLELAEALPRIVVRDLGSGHEHTVEIPDRDEANALGLVRGYEFDTARLRLTYSSPRTPTRTYDYDMTARAFDLRKTQRVPSGHAPEDYRVERSAIEAADGAHVPVTLLYRKDSPPAPGRPLLLYGYGAYGMAVPAGFSTDRLSLVDRGITYAIAHVRGGSERGYGWYLDGKLHNKPNSFRDFIAVAEGLVSRGYVRSGNIVANGRSAGGLLMGAVLNMRPELFRAVVAEVPFVDVLNTMCDASLPLTPPEWSEWGNPLEDPRAYETIASYSPYDNVAARPYPHVLATSGISDPRVTYWEPAKWIARLRDRTTGAGEILLHTNMTAGHAGSAGRFERLEETALVQSFVLWACGHRPSPGASGA